MFIDSLANLISNKIADFALKLNALRAQQDFQTYGESISTQPTDKELK